MATQRVIPIEEDTYPAQEITIQLVNNNYVPTPQACKIYGSQQQSVTFINNSGATVNITFEPNPITPTVFNDILNLANNTSSGPWSPLVADGTVNYFVNPAGGNSVQPYAIQVGIGPMKIQVVYDSALGLAKCTPDPVAIPYAGTLEMDAGDSNSYSVTWKNNIDPFAPTNPLTTVDNTPHTEDVAALLTYTFSVQKTPPSPKEGTGRGGGKVIVTN
jgi:hypothetical protein